MIANRPRSLRPTLRSLGSRAIAALACVAPVLLAPSAGASCEPDLGFVVSRLPVEVEFVAAVDDAASLRRRLGDSPLSLALASLKKPAEVIDAWSDLAADLRMTDDEAFDLLLGRRMVFAAAGLQAHDTDTQWALLSEVDPVTERRLRADLGAEPRQVKNGQPVLELEHGSFLLATAPGRLRCMKDGRFESNPASTILLLAPSEDRALFDSMLPLLHCRNPEATLSETLGGSATAGLDARDAVILWRMADPVLSPDRFLSATIAFEHGNWEIHALAGPAAGWVQETDLSSLGRWSPDMLDTLPDEPSLAVIGLRSMVRETRAWMLPVLAPSFPETDRESIEHLLGRRSMLAIWLDERSPTGAEVLSATESVDLRALAHLGDEVIASGSGLPSPDGPRVAALAPRGLSEERTMHVPPQQDPGSAPDRMPTLTWTYVPKLGDTRDERGWWVVHLDPSGREQGSRAEEAIRADGDPVAGKLPARRYLQVGTALPDRLSAELGFDMGAPPTTTPDSIFPTLMSRVRAMHWAVWLDATGELIEADLSLRAADPGAPAP